MYAKLNQFNLSDCVTKEDLVHLFEEAFNQWKDNSFNPVDRRTSPRIETERIKPLFVVSYSYNGKVIELNRSVPIVDISADGLGVEIVEPVPVGSTLCFAFDSQVGSRNFGVASVVRLQRYNNDYMIGLTFTENARSLSVEHADNERESFGVWFWKGYHAWDCIRRTLCRRRYTRRNLQKKIDGKLVRLEVEAKLFRYVATMYIDGKIVKSQSGPLNDRLKNIFTDKAAPTIISLDVEGYVAWATMRINKVSYISIQREAGRQLDSPIDEQDQDQYQEPSIKTLMASLQDIETNLRSLSVS